MGAHRRAMALGLTLLVACLGVSASLGSPVGPGLRSRAAAQSRFAAASVGPAGEGVRVRMGAVSAAEAMAGSAAQQQGLGQGPELALGLRQGLSIGLEQGQGLGAGLVGAQMADPQANNNDPAQANNNDPAQQGPGANDNAQCQEDGNKFPVCGACHEDGAFDVAVNAFPVNGPDFPAWEGWGTSLAWGARFLAAMPQDFQDNILDLLFDPAKGLGMTIVRYAIPASFNPGTMRVKAVSPKYIPQGFVPGQPADVNNAATWQFDWTQDAAQRNILLAAKQRGVTKVDAISYSPPWWLTSNKDVTGAASNCGKDCTSVVSNLPEKNFPGFAKYLAAVTKQYKKQWGVEFATVSPFNEPMQGWWFQGNYHEACSMYGWGIVRMSAVLRQELDAAGLQGVAVSMADNWADTSNILFSAVVKNFPPSVGRMSVHGYRLPQFSSMETDYKYYSAIKWHAKKQNRPVYQSEWGPMGADGNIADFGDLTVGLLMARSIIQHVNIMGAKAWMYWLAYQPCIGPCGWWGLVQQGNVTAGEVPRITKQFHVMKHFTSSTPVGALILDVRMECQHSVAAAYVEATRQLSVTIVNQKNQPATVNLCFNNFVTDDDVSTCQLYRTSQDDNYADQDCAALEGVAKGAPIPCFTANLDPTTLNTYTFGPVMRAK